MSQRTRPSLTIQQLSVTKMIRITRASKRDRTFTHERRNVRSKLQYLNIILIKANAIPDVQMNNLFAA